MVASDARCACAPDSCKKLFLFKNITQYRKFGHSSPDNAAICFHSTTQAGLAIGGWGLIGYFFAGRQVHS